jgi:hypothetical protein
MALSEFEVKRCEKLVAAFVERRRPPRHLRSQLDLAFRIQHQSVEIFEVRAYWKDPTQKLEERVAKATFHQAKRLWKVYWQRADLEWHSYEPMPEVSSLEEFLAVVEEDRHGCFFG